jgi:hypothetical protein
MSPAEIVEAERLRNLPLVNGAAYDQPSNRELARNYFHDTYGFTGAINTTIRALYSEARGKPTGWGTDFPGFAQRYGSAAAITAINGSVRYGAELVLHEDLRYLPCHHCSAKHKVENAVLAEFTARHGVDGHRSFSLTPVISDFSGPIIAHAYWYPKGFDPFEGVVATRVVFATRIGTHLVREFAFDHWHHPRNDSR